MVPENQIQATKKIASILSEIDPENALIFLERAQKQEKRIVVCASDLKKRLNSACVGEVKVVCSEMQAEFVKWAGFDVVATYGRSADISVADTVELFEKIEESHVGLIIDNLQSGDSKIGKSISEECGAIQIVLSNFPGAFENTSTWALAAQANVDLLIKATEDWRAKQQTLERSE